MADLDDFFAKKDRKKSKSVKKFATTDEVAKKLEDPKQKTDVRPKKERQAQEGEESSRPGEEEEWKEYEETVKDYTGLKIQVLQGNAAPEVGSQQSAEQATSEGGRPRGPWNKTGGQPEPEQAPLPPPPVEEKPREVKTAAYVPPASRVKAAEPVRRHHNNKNAPDIHNDDYFPVLGAASGGAKRGGGWSTAGAAGNRAPPPARQALSLGNRFNSLQDDS